LQLKLKEDGAPWSEKVRRRGLLREQNSGIQERIKKAQRRKEKGKVGGVEGEPPIT